MTLRQPATLGVVRGVSYGLFGPPDEFVPQAVSVGAGLVRVYVYWSQLEPRPGEYDWRVVDAALGQLRPGLQLWVTVCSSSTWGTRQPTDFQPPSPALDDAAYERFVAALVRRADGRVGYWQCGNEVSNTGILWAGTADEYGRQLAVFAQAVRRESPAARVVLAGCGYDALSSPPGSAARSVYETLVRDYGRHFDIFALNLYGDPSAIPRSVEWARALLREHELDRPIAVGEYNGPTVFEFPRATEALEATMAAAFADARAQAGGPESAPMSLDRLAEQVATDSPDRMAMRRLYAAADTLPDELRMFMHDQPAELHALRDRIACRQLVQRAVLILAAGVDTLACWSLAPEIGGYSDPLNVMDLMFGSLCLMTYRDGRIADLRPQGATHRLMSAQLTGATAAERIESTPDTAHAYRIHRPDGTWSLVAWNAQADPLDESTPPLPATIEWPFTRPIAVDAFGGPTTTGWEERARSLRLELTATPVFVTAGGR